jgi:dTMP kinase
MTEQGRQPDVATEPGSQGQAEERGFGPVLRSKQFRRLLIAQSASSLGDWVATFALMAMAFDLTGNQTLVAVVLVIRLVPPMFAAPVGGVVADRLPRRGIMVTADISRAALIALVPFVNIILLYAIAFVHECISLFFLPARDATVPELVPKESLAEGNGLILASSYGTLPIAAALFGSLRLVAQHIPDAIPFAHLFRAHPTAFAFFFDSATFVFSASLLAGLQLKHRPAKGTEFELVAGVVEGVKYVLGHQALRSLAYGLVVSMFGGGVLFAVGIAYIHDTLGGTDVQFGWLAALWGLGMGLGLLVVRVLLKRGKDRVFIGAVATCGWILIVMAVFPFLYLAFGVAVLFGMAFSIAIVLALTAAQEIAEDRIRGRVMGGVQMLFRVGLGAGALGIGGLAHVLGTLRLGFLTLDGNQVGMIVGGILILLGSVAASGIRKSDVWEKV